MILKIKKLRKDIKLPRYAYPGDAALDLYSQESIVLKKGKRHIFKLGFKTEIPKGYVALIWDKSSLGAKGIKSLGGVIDSNFRGEWTVNLQNISKKKFRIAKGEKIAQALIQKVEEVKIKEVKRLNKTRRGEGMYGSSGK